MTHFAVHIALIVDRIGKLFAEALSEAFTQSVDCSFYRTLGHLQVVRHLPIGQVRIGAGQVRPQVLEDFLVACGRVDLTQAVNGPVQNRESPSVLEHVLRRHVIDSLNCVAPFSGFQVEGESHNSTASLECSG